MRSHVAEINGGRIAPGFKLQPSVTHCTHPPHVSLFVSEFATVAVCGRRASARADALLMGPDGHVVQEHYACRRISHTIDISINMLIPRAFVCNSERH
jgi:hypothetical protein